MEDLEAITNHAISNKIAIIKVHGIELSFHPSAFVQERPPVAPRVPRNETKEQKMEREKRELDELLFHSSN